MQFVLLLEAQLLALGYRPVADEHHEDDDGEVHSRADHVLEHHHPSVPVEQHRLDARVGDEGDHLVDHRHRVEDEVELAKAVGVAHEPDYPHEGHHQVHQRVGNLDFDRPDEYQHCLEQDEEALPELYGVLVEFGVLVAHREVSHQADDLSHPSKHPPRQSLSLEADLGDEQGSAEVIVYFFEGEAVDLLAL